MTIQLLDLFDDTERLIARLEDACARICRPCAKDADFDPALPICALAERGSALQERLSAFRRSLPHRHDPLLAAAVGAAQDMAALLQAARGSPRSAGEQTASDMVALFVRTAAELKAFCRCRTRAAGRGS